MESLFKEWKESLNALHSSIGKELEEIHRCKAEVERLKDDMISAAAIGTYIHDDKRIVLSAPEIVIGNVGKDGVLKEGESFVTVRGNSLSLEAANNGSVTTRACNISQIAEEPGIDGMEHVVGGISQITSMARNVVLHSSDATGTFYEAPVALGSGIQIHSDSDLTVEAAVPCQRRKINLDDRLKSLRENRSLQKSRMEELEKDTQDIMAEIEKVFKKSESLSGDEIKLRSNAADLRELHAQFKSLALSLASTSSDYIMQMSAVAETERQIADLENESKLNDTRNSSYTKADTGAALSLISPNISLTSADGDGNIREDSASGINMKAKTISVNSVTGEGGLIPESALLVNTENVMLDTRNTKLDSNGENGEITTDGSVCVMAKTFTVTAVDSEMKDKKIKEKALVKDSCISFRTEKMEVGTIDTEGKATGSVHFNTKEMELKAMNTDKDSGEDKEMTAGSFCRIHAENMMLGTQEKDKNEVKQFQMMGSKMTITGKETTEILQGEGKASVNMKGDNLKMSGSETEISGKTTLKDDTEIKGDLKGKEASFSAVKASTSLKSPNISDGM